MNNLQSFHKAIAAVAPIDGVSGDKEIWFKPEATEEQKLAAQAIADSWVDGDEFTAWEISRRQFYQQAAKAGIITKQEAKAVIKNGTLPTILQNIVDSITDQDDQFVTELLLIGAVTFQREHPMTAAIGATLGWTEEQIDNFFTAASAL
jgi:hypothetical protein